MLEVENGFAINGYMADEPGTSFPKLEQTADISRPARVDLRPYCSRVEDQRSVGSCVANAIVGAMEFHQIRKGERVKDLSRLFVYYNARKLGGHETEDKGCSRVKALASVLGWGVCPEAMWPYQYPMVNEGPTRTCYDAAERFRAVQFAELEHGDPVRNALASGLPVVFGMALPPVAFKREAGKTGELKRRDNDQWEEARGGHAMLFVGYDDEKQAFLVRNSWGAEWGIDGHVWIDYDALMHYATPPHYYGEKPFVVGDVAMQPAYTTSGVSTQDVLTSAIANAGQNVATELAALRQSAATDLEDNLNKTRQSIRDRLRGPGAGGGY